MFANTFALMGILFYAISGIITLGYAINLNWIKKPEKINDLRTYVIMTLAVAILLKLYNL